MSNPYDILIDIRAKADEVQTAIAAINGLVASASSTGGALAGGMAQGQAATDALTGSLNTASTAASSTGAAVKQVGASLDEASGHAGSFREAMEQAFAFGIGNQIVEKALEVPTRLIEGFQEALHSGVEFDAEIEKLGIGIAGSLRQADPEHILNFAQAQQESGVALDAIRTKANQLGLDLTGLAETFQINLRTMTEAGVTSMKDQINLVLLLSQAAASKGISGFQAQRDIVDLLNGRGNRTLFSKELGITDDDIKTASQAGQLYQFLADKLSAYGEAGAAAADTFGAASQRLSNQVQQLEGIVAKPLFDVLKKGANDLAAEISSPTFQASFSVLAEEIGHAGAGVVSFVASLVPFIPAAVQTTEAVVALSVALGTGGLITLLGSAITEAGGFGTALLALAPKITGMLTALGPAGALLAAATAAMLLLEHATADMESRTRSLLSLFATLDAQRSALDKQIAGADTPDKQKVAYAALDAQLTQLVEQREKLRQSGVAEDSEQLTSIESEIGRTQARIDQFGRLAGAGLAAEKSIADASKYSGEAAQIAAKYEEQREAALNKNQTHQEAMANYDAKRIEAAKAFGLAETASYSQIQQAAEGLMGQEARLSASKPQLIDTSDFSAKVNEIKRQFAEVQTFILAAEKKANAVQGGQNTPSLTPQQADPKYDSRVLQAEALTGDLMNAQRVLQNAEEQNAAATRDTTSATQESSAAAEKKIKTIQDLQFWYEKIQGTQKAATLETIKGEEADVAAALAKAKLAAGPGATSPEVQALEVQSRELRYQQQYLAANGTLDAKGIQQAHERALAEVEVTNAKKAGTSAARDERAEDAAADTDRKTAIDEIRAKLAEVKGDPFISDADKIPQEIALLKQEEAQLLANIKARQAYIDAHQGDPKFAQKVSQYGRENVADSRQASQAGQQAQGLTTMGATTTDLRQLQNQWQLTSVNIGRAITQNIQTAVSGVSNAITGLITGTKNWRQAFAEAGSSIISSLIQIGVQMVASHLLGMILGQQSTQQQTANNLQIAASGAPAAAVTSISSYGTAAIVGTALAIAGIAAIIALAAGAFAEGGLIPGRPSHRDNRIAHVAAGEYVVRTAAVQHYGPGFFAALNSMSVPRTGFATGGLVGAGDGYTPLLATVATNQPPVSVNGHQVTLIQTRDRSEMLQAMQSSAGRKIVLSHVRGNRTKVGIPS